MHQRKSAVSTLHPQLVNRVEKALEHGQYALGGFIDLSNAFSNMSFRPITIFCFDNGIDNTTPAMLSCRVVSARLSFSHDF